MGDEQKEVARERSRSRSPRALTPVGPEEAVGSVADEAPETEAWAQRWRKAMGRKLSLDPMAAVAVDASHEDIEEAVAGEDDEEVRQAAIADESVQIEEVAYAFHCMGCAAGFHEVAHLHEHWRVSASCSAEPLQAVVRQRACLPGARTTLWCPACPENFIGKWSGPATKVPSLLRHLNAAGVVGAMHDKKHRRLQSTIVELLIADPPPSQDTSSLSDWAASCKLLSVAGPLLAQPSDLARKAVQEVQDDMLGKDPDAASEDAGEKDPKANVEDAEPDPNADKSRLRILGLDLTVDDAADSALYEDLPTDTGGGVEGGYGCALPNGGVKALTSFDLTLSSDEEVPPAKGKVGAREDDEEDLFI